MKIIFKEIRIKNFKGITELYLNFDENKNILEGENGIGKTTVLDAITWCLFGKNFADKQQFPIKPIIDGEERNDLITSVSITLNETLIERTWDTATTIKVDGVKFGVNEFKDYLREKFLITDEEFKSLSNIDYIPSLHWKDLRSLIMGLVGEIKNEEVYAKGDFDLIKDKIESVGVDKTIEDIKETKTNLNNEIKKLTGNIDQKTNDIQSLVVEESEVKELETRKETIKKEIDRFNELKVEKASQDEEIRELERMRQEKIANENEQQRLKDLNTEYQKTYDSSNIDVAILKENKIKQKTNDIENIKKDIERLDLEKSTLIAEREELRSKYDVEVNKEIKVENSTCTACGQPLPESKIQEVLSKLKLESKQLINTYVAKAKDKLTRMNEIDVVITSYNERIESLNTEIEKVKIQEVDSTQESPIQIQMKQNIESNNNKIEDLQQQNKKLEESIQILEAKIKEHKVIEIEDTMTLQNELEEITKRLAVSDTIKIFKDQLKELENKHQDLLTEKELLNDKEQQLILFNNTRAEMLRERVKHNFKIADFITQEETKDGKLVETFKISINGIEYSALNTGHKILVALDLIDNIQRMKDKRLPILIDGLGELTRLPELETQLIGCRAKFQANKKLEVVNQ